MSRLPHEGSMIGVQCQLVICRGHIRLSKWHISNISMVDGSLANWLLSHNLHFGLHFRSNLKGSLMGWEVKNLLSCQSEHGLMGSSAKSGTFLSRESQEWKTFTFLGSKHKSAIWDGTPPNYTSNLVYMCRGGLRDHKSLNGIQLSQSVHIL